MKVTVHNLGVIEEAEIDLKPLTIFIGPNNAGKTWLAYTLAGIFGPYGLREYSKEYLKAYEEGTPGIYPLLEKAVEQIINNGSTSIDLVRFAKEYGDIYFNGVARLAQRWMPQFMSTQIASFNNLDVSINLEETSTKLSERILNSSLRSEIAGGPQKPLLSIRKKRGDKRLYVYTSFEYASTEGSPTEEQRAEQLPADFIKEFLVKSVLQTLHRALYPQVCILPTERTTFITFPFGSRRADGGLLTIQEKSPQERKMKEMIGPVSSFLNMITATFRNELEEEEQREKEARNNPKIKKYIELAHLLEKQILSGAVQFSQPESKIPHELAQSEIDPAREVLFQPTKDHQLEISIASSMVKELSPLVLYLRYLARPDELLVIDEPEMNLHPEAQVKLIEFLAMLINTGLNVLITTHSPYFVDHLANLVKADEAEDKENISGEFYLKRTDAFISKHKVSVYLVDQGHTVKAMDEGGVIQWNTFGEVSDRISEIYFKL